MAIAQTQPTRSRPSALYQLALLATAMAVGGYARTAISPLQETMRIALGMSDNQMAILQGPAVGVPVILAAVPLGLLIDRVKRVRLVQLLILLSLVGGLLTAVAQDFTLLLLARSIAGVTGLGVLPVVFSLIADIYEPAHRGRATTAIIIGQVIGNSAAFALGGYALSWTGVEGAGWRTAMFWLSAPLVPILLVMLTLREPPRLGQVTAKPSLNEVWAELRSYRAIVGMLSLGIILVETAVGAMLIWAAPMLSRRFAMPPDQIGAVVGMGMLVSGVVGPFIGGFLADICQRSGGPKRTTSVLALLALASAPLGLFTIADSITLVSGLLMLAMTMLLAAAVMGMTLFTVVIPNELRGLCMSLLIATILLFSLAVAPPVVSLTSQALGGPAMIGTALSLVSVVVSLLAAGIFLIGRLQMTNLSTGVDDEHDARR